MSSLILLLLAVAPQDTTRPRSKPDTLEALVVHATRTGAAGSTSQSLVDRATITRTYAGQDLPLALQGLTAVTTSSDAGAFSGYSYLRLRGIDQTRLTISLDGVPLNDPEDQVLYFSNVPDFANSIQSIRIQRGVGSSGFGTASFGGSLSFESIPIAATPRFGEAQVTAGSFGTGRVSLAGATGLANGWAGYGRVSGQTTDGYRAHSGNDSRSGFFSAGWFGTRDALKLTGFVGRSKTHLAYYAASEAELAVDRRTNPMSPFERDDFHQEMVSLRYSRALTPSALLTATAYRNSAGGEYDVAVGSDLRNFNLDHAWYGLLTTLAWNWSGVAFTAGAHVSSYHRDHFLFVRPDLTSRIYDNTGYKQEQSGFVKVRWSRSTVDLHGDLELRRAAFQYQPTPGTPIGRPAIDWTFLNPKVGLTWRAGRSAVAHLSLGRAGREPTRSDLFAGADDLNQTLAAEVLPLTRVHPESVTDLEAGLRLTGRRAELGINAFAMRFRNEIAPIGQLSITGGQIRKNVARSHRTGIEIDGGWHPVDRVSFTGNLMLMQARIAEFTDEVAGVTYRDVKPLLSPAVIGALQGEWRPGGRTAFVLSARHIGGSQLANDGSATQVLPAATLVDAGLAVGWSKFEIRGQVQNLLNADAYANGYTDGTTRYLFPVATRTVLITTSVRLGRSETETASPYRP